MGKLKTIFETHKLYHVNGCNKNIKCPINLVRFNTHNTLEHELEKAKQCYLIQKRKEEFITEACDNLTGDVIDIINLSTGESLEIINTNGLEKAISNGRKIIKI